MQPLSTLPNPIEWLRFCHPTQDTKAQHDLERKRKMEEAEELRAEAIKKQRLAGEESKATSIQHKLQVCPREEDKVYKLVLSTRVSCAPLFCWALSSARQHLLSHTADGLGRRFA